MPLGQYDDAWMTPGWTVQWGYYPQEDAPTAVVAPPSGLKNVAITGSFFDDQARPMNGVFTFTPSVKLIRVGGSTVQLRKFMAKLVHGQLEDVKVVSPDGTVPVYPPAWTYHIRQRVGPSITEYDLDIPAADTVDVFNLQTETEPFSELPLLRDFTVIAGATFRRGYIWTQPNGSSDLSTWTAKMQIRNRIGGTILLELDQGAGITLGTDGSISLEITAAQTAALTNGVYDLELYQPGGDTFRFLEGTITVDPNVTV